MLITTKTGKTLDVPRRVARDLVRSRATVLSNLPETATVRARETSLSRKRR